MALRISPPLLRRAKSNPSTKLGRIPLKEIDRHLVTCPRSNSSSPSPTPMNPAENDGMKSPLGPSIETLVTFLNVDQP